MCELWKQTQREGETLFTAEKYTQCKTIYKISQIDLIMIRQNGWNNDNIEKMGIIYQENFIWIYCIWHCTTLCLCLFSSQYNYEGTDNDAIIF